MLFLNEMALLHAICGDTHKCGKFLTASVDILATDNDTMKCSRDEEEFHSQALHAAYMDIG